MPFGFSYIFFCNFQLFYSEIRYLKNLLKSHLGPLPPLPTSILPMILGSKETPLLFPIAQESKEPAETFQLEYWRLHFPSILLVHPTRK